MLKPILLFALGLIFLIKGGDWFVDGSVSLAKRFHIPEILIGATIVSIGTTLPEVMVSATAAVTGHSQTAYGNAIGSCICNVSLIAALTIAIRPSGVNGKTLRFPVASFFVAAILYSLVAILTGTFSRTIGIILLIMFAAYLTISFIQAKKGDGEGAEGEEEESEDMPLWKAVLLLAVGAALIAVGARLLVNNGSLIAVALGVPESVIALTFVALGTSLPELVTAITALVKGHSALSLGNIIGANLFNLVFVSGLATTLCPFDLPAEKTVGGLNASMVIDIPLMFLVMILMAVPALRKNRLYRWQGIVLLLLYFAYVTFQFVY